MNKRLAYAFFLMGFTSLLIQTVLIREFFIVFNGNELTIGIVLANWILLVAFGSLLGARRAVNMARPVTGYIALQACVSLLFPAAILLIRSVKNLLGLGIGEGMGIPMIFLASFAAPAAAGILTGMQFPFGSRILRETSPGPAGSAPKVYIIESIGFAVAGPVITYLFITRFDSFSMACIAGILNTSSALLLLREPAAAPRRQRASPALWILLICFMISLAGPASRLQSLSLEKQWNGLNLVRYENSIYGNLAVTKNGAQYTFYSNGLPVIVTPVPDIASIEDLVHFGMLSHRDPVRMLLIGGGAGGMIAEILKYPVRKLTYVELDPSLIKLVRGCPTPLTERELADKRLEIVYMDGRRFLAATKDRFDVVIVHLSAPSTLQLNRFYTKEFFQTVKSALGKEGVFVFALPGSLSYFSPELRDLNGCILRPLGELFSVFVIPGYSTIYLASERPLALNPAELSARLRERRIVTGIFNEPYLADRLDRQWVEWFNASIRASLHKRTNADLTPAGTYYAVSYWNSLFWPSVAPLMRTIGRLTFRSSLIFFAAGGLLAGLLILSSGRPRKNAAGYAIFTTGFMGMGLSLMLIYGYQSLYGLVFHAIALLISSFMAGLALGGWIITRSPVKTGDVRRLFLYVEGLAVLFGCTAALCFWLLSRGHPPQASALFFLLSALSGSFIGAEFSLANRPCGALDAGRETGGTLYALDLIGSWLAAFLVSFILVPLIGIIHTCLLLAVLKITSLVALGMAKR